MQTQQRSLTSAIGAPVEIIALPEVFSVVEKANLPALQASLHFPGLWQEAAVLQRLCYKNLNQHRASKHHQALTQIGKNLKLFRQLQLPELLQEFHSAAARTALPEHPAAAAAAGDASWRSSKRHQQQPPSLAAAAAATVAATGESRQTVRLPSLHAGCFVAKRLLCGCQLLLTCYNSIMTAAQHLSGQLSRGYFMPFCLVALACIARVRVLVVHALLQLMQAYNTFMSLMPLLPMQAAITSSSSSTRTHTGVPHSKFSNPTDGAVHAGLPQLLNLSWQGAVPSLQHIPYEQNDSMASRAAALQSMFCISWPAATTTAAAAAAGLAAHDSMDFNAAPAAAREGGGADLGVSVDRAAYERAFKQQQVQQQQSSMGAPHMQRLPRPTRSTANTPPPQPAAVAAEAAAVPTVITIYEDKQPVAQTIALAAVQQQQQGCVDYAPLYTAAAGLGLGLGLGGQRQQPPGITQQQQQQQHGIDCPPLYHTTGGLGLGSKHNMGRQPPGPTPQQQQQGPPGLPQGGGLPAAAAAAASTSDMQPGDQAEYDALYGECTHAMPIAGAAAAAAGVTPGVAAAPGPLRPWGGGSTAAVRVMHCHGSSSSSSDDDGGGSAFQQQQQAPAPGAAATQLAVNAVTAVPAVAAATCHPLQQQQLQASMLDGNAFGPQGEHGKTVAAAAAVLALPPGAQATAAALLASPKAIAFIQSKNATHDASTKHQQGLPAAAIAAAGPGSGASLLSRQAPSGIRVATQHQHQQQQQQQQQDPAARTDDWALDLITGGTTAAAAAGPAVATTAAAPSVRPLGSSKARRSRAKGQGVSARSTQQQQSGYSEGAAAAGGERDHILDMLLKGL